MMNIVEWYQQLQLRIGADNAERLAGRARTTGFTLTVLTDAWENARAVRNSDEEAWTLFDMALSVPMWPSDLNRMIGLHGDDQ